MSDHAIADLFWRTAYRIGFPLARLWWRLRRGSHEGALVAIWVGDAVLLVRSSYRAEWNLPGGGVWPGETPEAAARRELMEELGLSAGAFVGSRIVSGRFDSRQDRVHIFVWRIDTLPALRIDNREIVGARLVPRAQLAGLALTAPVRSFLAADAG